MKIDETSKLKVLIPEPKLQTRIKELAQEITQDFEGKEIVAICVLKGSFVFFADIIREIELPMACEFLGLSSYGSQTVSSGEVKVTLDINEPLAGKHVVVFEDIVDTGITIDYIIHSISARKPASLSLCTLLFKPDQCKTNVEIDYVGFKIENKFVLGYGVDYAGKYRGLPFVGYFEDEH